MSAPNSVFVGGLTYSITDDRLREFFSEAGPVKDCRVFMQNGRSRGLGVVEFEDEEGYRKALEMTDREFDGRKIFVREDRQGPREPREPRERRYDRHDGRDGHDRYERRDRYDDDRRERRTRDVAGLQLFVSNVPMGSNWRDVKDFFTSKFKAPGFVEVRDRYHDGNGPLNAIVRYDTTEDAQEAIEKLNDTDFNGNTISVRLDERA